MTQEGESQESKSAKQHRAADKPILSVRFFSPAITRQGHRYTLQAVLWIQTLFFLFKLDPETSLAIETFKMIACLGFLIILQHS